MITSNQRRHLPRRVQPVDERGDLSAARLRAAARQCPSSPRSCASTSRSHRSCSTTTASTALVGQYEQPVVAAFSSLMWNAQLSLRVAEQVKRRYPNCLVVFGGANVPHRPEAFLQRHPFIDVTVRGEGESPFRAVLERLATATDANDIDLDGIAGTSWRTPGGGFRHQELDQAFQKDLDLYPSPYLEGYYDEVFHRHPELQFQAIIETNRGCPFQCTFCYWGKGGMSRKYRFHGIDRVKAEIDWMAAKKIKYVFNADSNFGMHRRDMEIAEHLVASKQRTGYPHKFRTCYGKNTDEKIFAIGKLFHEHGLEKGITISYQSVDADVQGQHQARQHQTGVRARAAAQVQRPRRAGLHGADPRPARRVVPQLGRRRRPGAGVRPEEPAVHVHLPGVPQHRARRSRLPAALRHADQGHRAAGDPRPRAHPRMGRRGGGDRRRHRGDAGGRLGAGAALLVGHHDHAQPEARLLPDGVVGRSLRCPSLGVPAVPRRRGLPGR